MPTLEQLSQEIENLKVRNKRVEKEKVWETSWQKKLGIIVTTYLVMVIVFFSLGNEEPFLNAVVPTLGYTISTLSMEWLKKIFLNNK